MEPALAQAWGTSSGKIILMGEHAVVYGYPAIAMPFSAVQIVSKVTAQGDALTVSCAFYDGLVHKMPKVWESLKHAIRFSLHRIGAPTDPGLHIAIASSIPAERGMGSSAAVAVAVARSLFAFYKKELTDQELWEIVQSSEKIAHGNPSGIDTAATSGEDPLVFVKGQPIEPIKVKLDAYLVVADTGVTGNTLEAVSDVADLLSEQPEAMNTMRELGELTLVAKMALLKQDAALLGQVMTQAQGYLRELTVSEPHLDAFVVAALQAGALGAKLTGGGRGGCMIALAKDEESALQVEQALKAAGASQTWLQYLGERHDN